MGRHAGLGVALRRTFDTGRPWERSCGYSRAVRVGPYAETALCSPCADDGTVLHPGDVYRQTLACLELIRISLEAVGMSLDDVVKTRIYVADPAHWVDSGRAHGEVFRDIRPALGWVYMTGFFAPGITVEVEATAYRAG
jgi:enamine deaminase RidA (YjgF/YER057c/UK114 family)